MSGRHFKVGALVEARGREWVVLPESVDDLVVLRPLGATDAEITGILTDLEEVKPATFDPPDPDKVGDANSARLLRDALRLGFRSSAGPFRSFGRLAFEPRPYQLVPLLMSLRMDTVRMLIADDVGIGKTIEAGLIARELLDRGEIDGICILCPPHLAEQWGNELREKFNLQPELVLPSTARKLERKLKVGESLFDVHRQVIVSSDFIKSERHRAEFIRACPKMVIVDEAHTFAFGAANTGRHQRHTLLKELASDSSRHVVLATATPHSGKEDAFRSLLGLLNEELEGLPDDLSGSERQSDRRKVAKHLVQRRRADIREYLGGTQFPDRLSRDETYELTPEYKALFEKAVAWARETVTDESGDKRRQRVRWWSALALLRSIGSSPAAAAATLRIRASNSSTATVAEADELGRRAVLDEAGDEDAESLDTTPGVLVLDDQAGEQEVISSDSNLGGERLLELAKEAEALSGANDPKLEKTKKLVKGLLKDGFSPIIFCRFIDTAEYVAEHLRGSLGKKTEVIAVTGRLAPAERELRIQELRSKDRRVLVATDCLSEGINLQGGFDAVLHYDLAWNPTRHEQREGRVDRFGQKRPEVRAITLYGSNSPVDGAVLKVLLKKHRTIRNSLGISVPIPVDSAKVGEAILEDLIIRGHEDESVFDQLTLFEGLADERLGEFEGEWDSAAERERVSRTLFAQGVIKVDEVKRELEEVQTAIGSGVDAVEFVTEVLERNGARVRRTEDDRLVAHIDEAPAALREAIGMSTMDVRLQLDGDGALHLERTNPIVETLAAHTLDTALDEFTDSVASRCGVIRTDSVKERTVLLLLRLRFHLHLKRGRAETELLAESAKMVAYTGAVSDPEWLEEPAVEELLEAKPSANMDLAEKVGFIEGVLSGLHDLQPILDELARGEAERNMSSHERVRVEARLNENLAAEAKLPADVLGVYVFLPNGGTPE